MCSLTLNDTIHHWNAFANGTAGCCIQFHADRLFQILDKTEGVSHGPTKYLRMRELDSHQHTIDDLPYVKRGIFTSEHEYRIIAVSKEVKEGVFSIPIDLSVINKIHFSNKLPKSTFDSIQKILEKDFPDATKSIKTRRATTYDNARWINHFKQ